MLNTVKCKLNEIELEYHWRCIVRRRRQLTRLYEKGTPLSSEDFIAVSERLSRHCLKVQRLQLTSR